MISARAPRAVRVSTNFAVFSATSESTGQSPNAGITAIRIPAHERVAKVGNCDAGTLEAMSVEVGPAMTDCIVRQSLTVRAIGPQWQ